MGLPSSLKSYVLLFIFSFLNVTSIYSSMHSKEEEAVLFGGKFPALYVIGDSLVDAGNNNHLPTLIKADHPPYGSDFEGGIPTGRFSNGKTIADYIAIYYKLPLVPAFLGLSDDRKDIISTGFNYASAGCGIHLLTGKIMGKCLSMSQQVDLFEETITENLQKNFKTPSELRDHLADSLFMIAIGVNDYAFFFTKFTDSDHFADKLLHEYLIQIERLHKLGARKFFINNVKPLGCYPNIIASNEPRGSCNDALNLAIGIFNDKLKRSLSDMKQRLNNTYFLYSDYFNFMLGLIREHSSNKVDSSPLNTTSPCCPNVYDGRIATSCEPYSVACKEPNSFIFFDPFHPTQQANFHYSISCFHKRTICHVL